MISYQMPLKILLHAKRIASLANAVQGAIHSCSLAIHAIGSGLAQANGTNRKYANSDNKCNARSYRWKDG